MLEMDKVREAGQIAGPVSAANITLHIIVSFILLFVNRIAD